jgi:hypothetical protein
MLSFGRLKASFSPLFASPYRLARKKVNGVYMGDNGEVARVGDEYENVESSCERMLSVGELVEYWEGAFVRGRRLGLGEPDFVKRVEGEGVYAIKMVGNSRGKFRIVGWKSLFKDESFNKNVARWKPFFSSRIFLFSTLLVHLIPYLCPGFRPMFIRVPLCGKFVSKNLEL